MATFLQYISEQVDSEMQPADILSKLASLDKEVTDNQRTHCVTFGLEDSHGNIVKVHVQSDQADDFERALAMEMDPESEQSSQEIAEVLYKLHDRFDITDVNWPTIEEDEEGDETGAQDFENPEGDAAMGDDQAMDPNADPMAGGEMGGTEDKAASALDSVLQALIANAEADRQDAIARSAEAKAKEAEAAAKLADQKLKAEEEVADMEAYHDAQNDEKKEAKKLAKLAKYRHTMKQRDNETGPFDNAGDALAVHKAKSEERMDQPSGENPPGTDPDQGGNPNADIQPEIDDVGFENEEREKPKRMEVNRRFKDLTAAVKFLHSLKVRRAVHND